MRISCVGWASGAGKQAQPGDANVAAATKTLHLSTLAIMTCGPGAACTFVSFSNALPPNLGSNWRSQGIERYIANSLAGSLNALNSSALPEGS